MAKAGHHYPFVAFNPSDFWLGAIAAPLRRCATACSALSACCAAHYRPDERSGLILASRLESRDTALRPKGLRPDTIISDLSGLDLRCTSSTLFVRRWLCLRRYVRKIPFCVGCHELRSNIAMMVFLPVAPSKCVPLEATSYTQVAPDKREKVERHPKGSFQLPLRKYCLESLRCLAI